MTDRQEKFLTFLKSHVRGEHDLWNGFELSRIINVLTLYADLWFDGYWNPDVRDDTLLLIPVQGQEYKLCYFAQSTNADEIDPYTARSAINGIFGIYDDFSRRGADAAGAERELNTFVAEPTETVIRLWWD